MEYNEIQWNKMKYNELISFFSKLGTNGPARRSETK